MNEPLTVYTRADLEELGMTDRAIRKAVAEGRAHRIRPGAFVKASEWRAAHSEQRQRAGAQAALQAARGRPVFAGVTAAAVQGLPLFRERDDRVHVLAGASRAAAANAFVVRHEAPLDDQDVVDVDGMLVTSLDRTVFDLIRVMRPEAGVALTDAALRLVPVEHEFRDRLRERIARAPGARGIRRARIVADFADSRADSPGESASRWFLHVLGFRVIRLQVHFLGPDGSDLWVDFGFKKGHGEFDGASKYTDPHFLRGRTPEQALIDEKRREDWLRGITQEPFARWMDRDMPNARALGARLASFGIHPDE
ncbi:hypothetical protein B5M43_006525 [Microbacterium sp. MEC084]|uniref:type IV toxin-antitoxin system AbiEi family antitoxin domain-containing protein n=1 Tax=Microbacterium sp. MEC084 TaxID=1963027 RepID=UPI00106F2D9E|nr:type IV toxin-antitoxin system AbiEi family antitoxin domain-containing protein [Microbacterium sp. MEC084]MCD1268508.1 hypothetical protein [Microbacterium sp. MEC084]